jgi:undecaprenyl-diphosphatase
MGAILRADEAAFLWLNQWVGRFPALDALVKVLVSDYFAPVLLSLVLLGMWFLGRGWDARERSQRAVLRGMIALGFANLAVFVMNHYFYRPRPFTQYEVALLFYRPTDSSFPANPAAVSFAIATSIWGTSRRLGLAAFGMATLWSLSRVYAGVFYPLDVIAGALLGVVISHLVALALRLIEPIPTLVLKVARLFHLV